MKKLNFFLFVIVLITCCTCGYAQSQTFYSDANWLGATSAPPAPGGYTGPYPYWAQEILPLTTESAYFTAGSGINPIGGGAPYGETCPSGTTPPYHMWIANGNNPNPNPFVSGSSVYESNPWMTNDDPVYFRKHFNLLSTNVSCSDLKIFADDYAEVYINGREITHTLTNPSGVSTWSTIVVPGAVLDSMHLLRCGDNVIAILGKNNVRFCWYVVFSWSFTSKDTITVNTTLPTCTSTGSATASITPTPASTITYAWSNGDTGATINGLIPGIYTVTAYNGDSSCYATVSDTIVSPALFSVSATGTPAASCGDSGKATATVSPATTTGVTYTWSNGDVGASITGLVPGIYTVTASTSSTCFRTATVTIAAHTAPYTVSINPTSPRCTDSGKAVASVSPATSGVTYLWSNGGTGNTITGLVPGTYTVIASDSASCQDTTSVTFSAPTIPVDLSFTAPTCSTGGIAIAHVDTSFRDSVTYYWSTGGTNDSVSGLLAGFYTVNVYSGLCSFDSSFYIFPPAVPFTLNPTAISPTCNANGSAEVTVSGDSGAVYTYRWSTGATKTSTQDTMSIYGLGDAGLYYVTVSTGPYCYTDTFVTISAPTVSYTLTVTGTGPICTGPDSGRATVVSSLSGVTYLWSNGKTTSTITGLTAGTYTVTASNTTGCTVVDSITLVSPICCTKPTISFVLNGDSLNNDTICYGTPVTMITTTTGTYIQYHIYGSIDTSSGVEFIPYGVSYDTLPPFLATVGTHTLCVVAFASNPDTPAYVPCSDTFCRTFTVINCCSKPVHAKITTPSDSVCINSILAITGSGGPYGQFLPNYGIKTPWGVWGTGGIFATGDTPYLAPFVPDTFTAPGTYTICYVAYSANPDSTPYPCTDTTCITINIHYCPCTPPTGNYIGFTTQKGDSTNTICEGSIYYLHLNSTGVWGTFLVDGSSQNGIDSFAFVQLPGGGIVIGPLDTPLTIGVHKLCLISHSTFPDGQLPDCPDTTCTTFTLENCGCNLVQGTSHLISHVVQELNYEFYDSFTAQQPNFITWIIDDSTVGMTAGTDTFHYPLKPGSHTVCMQTATILTDSGGMNVCCYSTYCDTINIDACTYWKATDTITYQLDSLNIDSVTFTFHGSTSPIKPIIIWNFGDGSPDVVGTDLTVSHIYKGDNNYQVCAYVVWSKGDTATLFDSSGVCCCLDTVCLSNVYVSPCALTSFSIKVDTIKFPIVAFQLIHSTGYTVITGTYWAVTDPSGHTTDLGYSGDISPNYDLSLTGKYIVCLKYDYTVEYNDSSYPCSGYLCDTFYFAGPKGKESVAVYPNPNQGALTVQINNYEGVQSAKIEIDDLTGRAVMQRTITGLASGITQNYLDIRSLPQGVYTIKVNIGDMQQVNKLVKE